jgi:hypothetical protein
LDDEMAKAALQWTGHEFVGLDLGDGRLNKRAARQSAWHRRWSFAYRCFSSSALVEEAAAAAASMQEQAANLSQVVSADTEPL